MERLELASHIEHTLLRPNATMGDFSTLVTEANVNGFYGIVVPSYWIEFVSSCLYAAAMEGYNGKLIQTVGFPLGNSTLDSKLREISPVVQEVDMVMNVGAFLSKEFTDVHSEICAIKAMFPDKILKVIISTPYLSDKQIRDATKLVSNTPADFVKTCTGYEPRGVTLHDLLLISYYKRDTLKIKASGKIQDLETSQALLHAGADRLGTSSGLTILRQLDDEEKIQKGDDEWE